jgi:predicted RNA-binding Zn-ribbon protein involved in translation (DUF1610 family)
MTEKKTCPDCNVDMNRHAEKLDVFAAIGVPEAWNEDLGGSIEELFCCPDCGKIDSVRGA